MTADISEFKKEISRKWQEAIPQLSMYSKNKFYKVVSPAIIGLELIRLPFAEKYRPYFVAYSLLGNGIGTDLKACLSAPFIFEEYKNRKGFQFNIPYRDNDKYFNEVLESVKEQTPLPLSGDISLTKLFSTIEDYAKTSPLRAAPNSYLQAALQATKLKMALYISVGDAQNVLEQINKRDWDSNHFKYFGVDVKMWLEDLKETINNREKLLDQLAINKEDKKIKKLNSSEFIA